MSGAHDRPSLWRVWFRAVLGRLVMECRSGISLAVAHRPPGDEPAFQFLRMISPLASMPVAVLAFSTWEGAMVFLIAARRRLACAVLHSRWGAPHGSCVVQGRPQFRAGRRHILTAVILPAIAQDILTGVRLALGMGLDRLLVLPSI